MRTGSIISACVLVMLGVGSLPAGAANMITNSGFEAVDGSTHPTDWSGPVIYTNSGQVLDYNYNDGAGGTVAIIVDGTVYHGGSNSLKVSIVNSNRQVEFIAKGVMMYKNTNYIMSAWMKCSNLVTTANGSEFGFRFGYPPGGAWRDGISAITQKGTKDWAYYEESFKWSENDGSVNPALSHNKFNPGTGTVWLDDAQLSVPISQGVPNIEEKNLWLFDGNVSDETTNRYRTGYLSSVPYTNDVPSIRGADYPANRSILLDGVDDYVRIIVPNVFQSTPITVEAWIKPTGAIQGGLTPVVNSWDGYQLDIAEVNGTAYKVRARVSTTLGWSAIFYGSTTFVPGAWHKIGFTYDGALVTVYLDGQPVGTQAQTGNLIGPVQNQWIHVGNNGGATYFRGQVDEVSIVHRALNAAEILARYTKSRTYVSKGTAVRIK